MATILIHINSRQFYTDSCTVVVFQIIFYSNLYYTRPMHKVISWKQRLSHAEKLPIYALIALLSVLTAVGLSVALLSIYYSKPIGDDFGAIQYYHSSAWLSHTFESLSTTGRYGQSIASTVIYGLFGDHTSTFLSLIIISWIVLLVFVYLRVGATRLQLKMNPLFTLGASLVISFLLLFVNKAIDNGNPPTWLTYQLFFWPSGAITYVIPVLTLLTVIYLLLTKAGRFPMRKKLLCLAITVYATGLFNEIQPSTLTAICAAFLILSLIPYFSLFKKVRPFLYASGIASLAALLTSFFSAGSRSRQASLATQIGHDHLVQNVLHNLNIALRNVYFRPQDILLCIAIGLLISIALTKYKKFHVLPLMLISAVSLLVWFGSLVCSFVLVGYGYGDTVGIYPRTLFIPQISYVLGIITIGVTVGALVLKTKKRYIVNISLIMIAIGITLTVPRYLEKMTVQLSSSLSYSNAWTYEDQYLKEQAIKDPSRTIYLPPSTAGIGDGFSLRCNGPFSSSTIWLNDLIEKYYKLREVCSTQDKPQG
jgi:hypothetical protein